MDHRQRDATAALKAAIQLGRGQPAPASQPDQPPNVPPQQGPHSGHPQHHHTPPQPASPQRPEQPPATQQDIPFQDPEQQPPSRAGRDNSPQQSLWKNGVKSTQEFMDRANQYIKLEEAIANEGKSPADDQGPKEDPNKAANGSGKPNGNDKNNGKNGGKRVNHEPPTSENKRPKSNRYETRFTNYTTLVDSREKVYQATNAIVPFR
ncbi:uncharacterized protein LOC133806821 [Humulus lupulus]|uniref:uncharacterized protein LOC133806821 n=1 Tax=Humulus lupulus TaxID=3486 RepID=UPI002B40CD8C|nr:uncharacterized protein LOC133806821 [Humulus lupulus]